MKWWLTLLSIFGLAGCAAPNPTVHGIPNFGIVDMDRKIFRGGEPETKESYDYLADLGVHTILKLNPGLDEIEDEGRFLVIHIPISSWDQIMDPPQLGRLLLEAASRITNGTAVHCQHGSNRTGGVIGVWRVKYCGWTKAQAQVEMDKYGWEDSLPGLKAWWRDWKP